MSEPYLGEIRMFAGNFAIRGWASCNGELLSINQHQALYSILGTNYGGDGRTTFSLPDLRGRAAMHPGSNGSSSYTLGQKAGSESVALDMSSMPNHSHAVFASTTAGVQNPTGGYLAAAPVNFYLSSTTTMKAMHDETIVSTGSGGAHENRQPYLAINFLIALTGTYPPRN